MRRPPLLTWGLLGILGVQALGPPSAVSAERLLFFDPVPYTSRMPVPEVPDQPHGECEYDTEGAIDFSSPSLTGGQFTNTSAQVVTYTLPQLKR